ncbi:hypothetical protein D3C71_1920100 [compost metagenome]
MLGHLQAGERALYSVQALLFDLLWLQARGLENFIQFFRACVHEESDLCLQELLVRRLFLVHGITPLEPAWLQRA